MAKGKRVEVVNLIVGGFDVDAKACTKCGEVKLLTEFHVDRTKRHGRQARCKVCQRKIKRGYVEKSAEEQGRRAVIRRRRVNWTADSYKQEIHVITNGTYLLLDTYTNSMDRLLHKHLDCGKEYYVRPSHFINLGSRCPFCAKVARNHDMYVKDVQDMYENNLTVIGTYNKIGEEILHLCRVCGSMFSKKPDLILQGHGCVECYNSNRKKSADEFICEVSEIVGDDYLVLGEYRSALGKVKLKHNSCGKVFDMRASAFLGGQRCPQCRESKGERRVRNYLETHGANFEGQISFEDCRNKKVLPFDFGLHLENSLILIEYDGEQHSRPVDFAGRGAEWAERQFRRVQRNDAIKTEYCRANGIPLIRIDYTQFDEIEAILDRELSALGVTGKRNNTDNNDIKRKEDAA